MAQRTAVLLVVGLTESVISDATPALRAFRDAGRLRRLRPPLPAVTCTSQSTILTGLSPGGHGVVANGWYDRAYAEPRFWKQSAHLVHGERLWDTARRHDPAVTCASMFWWFNMHASAQYAVTPRPQYRADGRKVPDCYSAPPQLRDTLQQELGPFPLFRFWGPGSSIESTRWIARAAARVDALHDPTLSLVYLPHLDYALQKHGPDGPEARRAAAELDPVLAGLIEHHRARNARVMILSEYGIAAVDRPVHLNRALRQAGLLSVRHENALEHLDPGASRAFALADHQVALVYVARPQDVPHAAAVCRGVPGVEGVLDEAAQRALGLWHERSPELLAVAQPGAWFTYYYWLDDALAPDFARTVDIHRKPGYDPCELFVDPRLGNPTLAVGHRLIRRKLGLRTLLDVIPLDATLVRGSHGRVDPPGPSSPVLITDERPTQGEPEVIDMSVVRRAILDALLSA
ncbi:MAG: alkaline phosphatase family protein [Isosphaera sp.]|nr:alkaline phosphatase family protein [Isosphaera sp.]